MYLTTDLLIDSLVLVLHTKSSEARATVTKLLDIYSKNSRDMAIGTNDTVQFYITLIAEVMERDLSISDSKSVYSYLLKLKSNPKLSQDPELYTSLKNVFSIENDDWDEDKEKHLLRKIANVILWQQSSKDIKHIFGKLNNFTVTDLNKQEAVLKEVNTLCSRIVENNEAGIIENKQEDENQARFLDFTDKATIEKALTVYNTTSVENKFKTGLQGLNKALGGGYALGSSIVFNARSNNGKSLFLLKMARWQVTLNTVSAKFKNPTCIFYSLENETPQNVIQLFNELYINENKQLPPTDLSIQQIVDYCHDKFAEYGWKLVIDRRLPNEFGFAELVANFESYIRAGYTPLMCVVDYANKMIGDGADEGSSTNLKIEALYTNLCNYLKSHNCTFVTAHQLNRRADEVVANNPVGAVKKFNPSMLANSTSVQREVDLAFYVNKESDNVGRTFMTVFKGKDRYNTSVPESDKYFAYMFEGPLGILDDINGDDCSTTNIYDVPHEKEENAEDGNTENGKINLF